MRPVIFTHPACLEHNPGPSHPERPARLHAILEALDEPPLDTLERVTAPEATREQLERVHDPAYVARVFEVAPTSGFVGLDPDTWMSPGSLEAARAAAGAVCAAVDLVMGGSSLRAFAAVRPPGHHAERDRAMGFCVFNSVAVGAAHAIARWEAIERVAIVDFDVHHGNGTQHIFEANPAVAYASSHQFPFYPGTGAADERGVGNIFNAPLASFAGSSAFREAWSDDLLPKLRGFDPDLLILSAGFDAHRDDPLASLQLDPEDFAWLTAELVALAEGCAEGRVVSALEGGYGLKGLSRCVRAHLQALEGSG